MIEYRKNIGFIRAFTISEKKNKKRKTKKNERRERETEREQRRERREESEKREEKKSEEKRDSALRVPRAETRLTVYRSIYIMTRRAEVSSMLEEEYKCRCFLFFLVPRLSVK